MAGEKVKYFLKRETSSVGFGKPDCAGTQLRGKVTLKSDFRCQTVCACVCAHTCAYTFHQAERLTRTPSACSHPQQLSLCVSAGMSPPVPSDSPSVLFAASHSRKLCVWCSHHHLASGDQIFDHFYSKMSWATLTHRCICNR